MPNRSGPIIEIDPGLLRTVVEAGDDVTRLVELADIDPEDFLRFMQREGLVEDRVARRIHQASFGAREAGPRATIVDRTRSSFLRDFREYALTLDRSINALIPDGIRTPRQRQRVPFETERLLLSLASIGIPVLHGISITERLVDYLERHDLVTGGLDTGSLRTGVMRAIYSLPRDTVDRKVADRWAARYAQRYGNPRTRTSLRFPSGAVKLLSYKLVRTRIVPSLISRVLGVSVAEARVGGLSTQDLDSIAKQVLEIAQGLPAYEISSEVLLDLAVELSTQPPHPWFVRNWLLTDTVRYDLGRARNHALRLRRFWDDGNFSLYKHSAIECIHHSSSALLGYYGAFLGSDYLQPLHQLSTYLGGLRAGDVFGGWSHMRIAQMPGDLHAIGSTLDGLAEQVNGIARNVNDIPVTKWHDLSEWAETLYNVVRRLLVTRRRELDRPIESGAISTGDGLAQVIRALLVRTTGTRIIESKRSIPAFTLTSESGREVLVYVIEGERHVERLSGELGLSVDTRLIQLVFCSERTESDVRRIVAGSAASQLVEARNIRAIYSAQNPRPIVQSLIGRVTEVG